MAHSRLIWNLGNFASLRPEKLPAYSAQDETISLLNRNADPHRAPKRAIGVVNTAKKENPAGLNYGQSSNILNIAGDSEATLLVIQTSVIPDFCR